MITDSAEGGELETDYDDGCPIVPPPAVADPALRLGGFPGARIAVVSAFPTMATANPAIGGPAAHLRRLSTGSTVDQGTPA